MLVEFIDKEKIKYFDEICSWFFDGNFTQLSKTEIETRMFSIYYEKLLNDNTKNNKTNYQKCSDYVISKDLGITQQRVSNYKVKSQLFRRRIINWKDSFFDLVQNARIDRNAKKITVYIPDPNILNEIQNYIENEKGGFIEVQLNKRLLTTRVEYFLLLLASLEDKSIEQKMIKALVDTLKKGEKENKQLDERNVAKELINSAVQLNTVVSSLVGLANISKTVLTWISSQL